MKVKRILSLILSLTLMLTGILSVSFAESEEPEGGLESDTSLSVIMEDEAEIEFIADEPEGEPLRTAASDNDEEDPADIDAEDDEDIDDGEDEDIPDIEDDEEDFDEPEEDEPEKPEEVSYAFIFHNLHRIRYPVGQHIAGLYHVTDLCSDCTGYWRIDSSAAYSNEMSALWCLSDLGHSAVHSGENSSAREHLRRKEHALY